ncbi:MAG: spermidine synthase [Clostridia bacterium]|nr:spermidine synthase [Clostridia bacterium]
MSGFNIFEKENVSLYLDDLTLLQDVSSELQSVQLYKHPNLEKVLVINDEIQHVENWMPYYHEQLVHIPMMFIKVPRNVLILGGGDLFAASEVFKYDSVKQLVLCDYDKNVIELTSKHYSHSEKVLEDSRLKICIDNAINYINNCTEKFDLIIDDCFNLVDTFDSCHIFEKLKSLLTPEGVCCSLVYRHVFDKDTMNKTKTRLFDTQKTVLSLITVPEYPGVLHLLTIWGNSSFLDQNLKKTINTNHSVLFNSKCTLFNSDFCNFYMYLPPYVKKLL